MDKELHRELRRVLKYSKRTGVFTWRVPIRQRGRVAQPGDPAGSVTHEGYIRIQFGKRRFFAHRLAWFYVHGEWPTACIDHKNGVRSDNRFSNLRDVSHATNMKNSHKPRGSNPYIGVTPYGRRWRVYLNVGGKNKYLGSYPTPEEARDVYLAERAKHYPVN